MSSDLKLLLTTHDDPLLARVLAKTLVEQQAAACVNIITNAVSVFNWEGEIQTEDELLLLIKTTAEHIASVRSIIEENHTYEVPELVEIEGTVLHKPYMEWVRSCLE
ncbi:MAG: divalent-cation tolerance protein CutA [Candidatus Marinimicrobia bacterium]|nr:divalent-cation tolerance protein CutA [Candidatus Neomarinimicrobiota bacterium]